jgi:hypothetical protein
MASTLRSNHVGKGFFLPFEPLPTALAVVVARLLGRKP